MSILDALMETISPMRVHVVKYPENLATISQRYYGTPDCATAIFQANRDHMTDPNRVYAGMRLVIPHIPHVVQRPRSNCKSYV